MLSQPARISEFRSVSTDGLKEGSSLLMCLFQVGSLGYIVNGKLVEQTLFRLKMHFRGLAYPS